MNITWIGSPNYTTGRQGASIDKIICHWMVGTLSSTDSVFQNTTRGTSAHYGVGQGGQVHQYVRESDTAYHAGNWNANITSIGIEHEGGPTSPITESVYQTSAELIAQIWSRYGRELPLRKHNEFNATQCPGTLDINKLTEMARAVYKGEKKMTRDDWIMYNWYRLLEEDFPSQTEFNQAINANADYHFNNNHTLRTVLNDEAKQPNFAKNIARDERARRKALEIEVSSVRTQLQQAISSGQLSTAKVRELEAQLAAAQANSGGSIPQATIDTINETNGLVRRIWDAITRLWRV